MAEAVAGTLENGGVLLVEAGTGTGKTLAYLVPAILSGTARARLDRHKEPPGADLLQGSRRSARGAWRAVYRDLHEGPRQLSLPAPLRIVSRERDRAARRSSSASRRRRSFCRSSKNGRGRPRRAIARRSRICRRICRSGERSPRHRRTASAPSARATPNASSRACARAAAESNLVVVNHHLLCADAAVRQSAYGEVIPECSYAIVDEAHQLEDVATQYFGVSVSNYRFDELVRDGERLIAAGVAGEKAPELRDALDRARDRAHDFFRNLGSRPCPRARSRRTENRVRITVEDARTILRRRRARHGGARHARVDRGADQAPSCRRRKAAGSDEDGSRRARESGGRTA